MHSGHMFYTSEEFWMGLQANEQSLLQYAADTRPSVPGLRIIGNPMHRVGSISLIMEGIETQKLGKFLDSEGIAVRASHHCVQYAG